MLHLLIGTYLAQKESVSQMNEKFYRVDYEARQVMKDDCMTAEGNDDGAKVRT